jgi:hypothetical protein
MQTQIPVLFARKNTIILLTLLLLFFSINLLAQTRDKNIWYGDAVFYLPDGPKLTRIFIDKYGSIYPKAQSSYVAYGAFNFEIPAKKDEPQISHSAVKHHFDEVAANKAALHYFFNFTANEDKWRNFVSSVEYTPQQAEGYLNSFFHAEELLTKYYANIINRKFDSGYKTLVILIHGFNDENPAADYQLVETDINARFENVQFLEVFWDGLTANQGNPGTSGIWGPAQNNSRYIGLRIRKLLQDCNPSLSLRILTHSLGASVANFTFFNSESLPIPKDFIYANYYEPYTRLEPKQTDARIAYFAPAIPGVASFQGFNRLHSGNFPFSKIIVSHNKNDYALRKNKQVMDITAKFGSTTFGCNYKDEINQVQKLLANKQFMNFSQYDFSIFPDTRENLEQHALRYYRLRPQYKNVVDELMKVTYPD